MDSNLITAVGIDVSKGKSTVAIRRPGGEIVRKPFTVKHDQPGLQQLIQLLHEVGGEIRIYQSGVFDTCGYECKYGKRPINKDFRGVSPSQKSLFQ